MLIGRNPGANGGAQVEADLDVEWAGAVARNATLIYVYAANVDTAVQAAINQNLAPVISMSFGLCEQENTSVLFERGLAQQANAQGITWLAASGDSGAGGCEAQGLHPQATRGIGVQAPSSFPEVTSVGGTQFDDSNGDYWNPANGPTNASAKSYIPEAGWNETDLFGLLASGGGASRLFGKPAWQAGPGVPADNARDVPDVSLAASGANGYYVISGGAAFIISGTSASTPSLAGVVSLLNHFLQANSIIEQPGLGNINPTLYRLAQTTPSAFHDVMSGNNIVPCQQASPNCPSGFFGFQAGAGYDQVTGLGSVDVNQLVSQWNTARNPTTTSLSVYQRSVLLTGTIQLTAAVTPSSGVVPPTGTITFRSGTQALGSVALSSGAASLIVYATQFGVANNAGSATITALYTGDNFYDGSSGTAMITVSIPASGSAVVPTVAANPVYPNIVGTVWTVALKLTEVAGVATRITSFTVDGAAQNLNVFSSVTIPAFGSIQASIAFRGLTTPLTRTFTIMGMDPGGRQWTQEFPVTFFPTSIGPAIGSLVSPPIPQNPNGDPTCQWQQPVVIYELNGFAFQLTKLMVGGVDQSGMIAQYFGTTHLAPFGSLTANICFSGITPPRTENTISHGFRRYRRPS